MISVRDSKSRAVKSKQSNHAAVWISTFTSKGVQPLTVRCAKLILTKALTLCWEISLKRPGWTLALQTWSVIGERSNRWFNTNNTLSPKNKRSYCLFRPTKIVVWKSHCTTRTWGKCKKTKIVHFDSLFKTRDLTQDPHSFRIVYRIKYSKKLTYIVMELDLFFLRIKTNWQHTKCRPFIANLHPRWKASDPKRHFILDTK